MGGSDVGTLQMLTATLDGTAAPFTGAGVEAPVTIGNTNTIAGSDTESERLLIIGKFTDGSTQILLDKRL
jgi:hypothetical protein